MSKQTTSATVLSFPARAVDAEADASIASVIEVLQGQLALAREGQLRSVAVVGVSQDGNAISTQWSCTNGDVSTLIGKLSVLSHDLMTARE